jgi:hypothetical protein
MKDCAHRVPDIETLAQFIDRVKFDINRKPVSSRGFCKILTLYTNHCIPQKCTQSEFCEDNCPDIEFSRH